MSVNTSAKDSHKLLNEIFGLDVKGLTSDSRKVHDGYIFVLLKASNASFVESAIARGASVIIVPEAARESLLLLLSNTTVKFIFHHDPRDIYHLIAARLYPGVPESMLAVTGTNGKGSVCYIFQHLMFNSGMKIASIGTMGISDKPDCFYKPSGWLTTPDAADLHCNLHKLHSKKYQGVIVEASSHGLVQKRLDAIKFQATALTNFSQDHLDFHKDSDSYLNAKIRLFSQLLSKDGVAVLNRDIEEYSSFASALQGQKIIDYGANAEHIKLIRQEPDDSGQNIWYNIGGKDYKSYLRLLGKFQGYNLLCAIGLVRALGLMFSEESVKFIKPLKGRMEVIKFNDRFSVIIDYAHTPDALKNALYSLRWHGFQDIIVVFGCGGNRDASKRKIMGEVAQKYADRIVICDDNPRNENPQNIRSDILQGIKTKTVQEIGDRKKAIITAIDWAKNAQKKTALLVAGKGDESVQIIGDLSKPFSDREVVIACLKAFEE